MIDHLGIGVADYGRSTRFYDRAFGPLGLRRLVDHSDGAVKYGAYGDTSPWFWLADQTATSGTLHLAVAAKTRAEVDAFHREALAAGGTDNGAPGLRPQYEPGYYAAFVLDPDGHNIEAVFHDPSVNA